MSIVNEPRLAVECDLEDLCGLIGRYWAFEGIPGFEPTVTCELIRRLLLEPTLGCFWILCDQNQALGYLLMVYSFSLEFGGAIAEIDELFVVPEQRGRGCGAALLNAASAAASARGCRRLSLQVGADNDAASAFYARQGFAPRTSYGLLEKPLIAR